MIPWPTVAEWGQRLAVVTGLATPVYGGLAYLKLTPVTENYVANQVEGVRREVVTGRANTLDTKRAVLGLARTDLIRERVALEGTVKVQSDPSSRLTFTHRLATIVAELERIDRAVGKLDDIIAELKSR